MALDKRSLNGTKKIDTKAALKMKLAGVPNSEIAKLQGVTRDAVYKHLTPLLKNLPSSMHLDEYQEKQADILDAIATGIVGSIKKKDLDRASLHSKITSLGILVDKSRLVRGQSTNNSISIILARHVNDAPLNTPSLRQITVLDDDI
jgi:predicted transcriptional regulator